MKKGHSPQISPQGATSSEMYLLWQNSARQMMTGSSRRTLELLSYVLFSFCEDCTWIWQLFCHHPRTLTRVNTRHVTGCCRRLNNWEKKVKQYKLTRRLVALLHLFTYFLNFYIREPCFLHRGSQRIVVISPGKRTSSLNATLFPYSSLCSTIIDWKSAKS